MVQWLVKNSNRKTCHNFWRLQKKIQMRNGPGNIIRLSLAWAGLHQAMNNKTDYPEEEGEGEGATYRHGFGFWRNPPNLCMILLVKQWKFLKCWVWSSILVPKYLTEQLSSAQIRYWCIFVLNLGGKSFNIWEHRAAKNSLSAAVFLGHQECQSSTLSRMFSKNRGGWVLLRRLLPNKLSLWSYEGWSESHFFLGKLAG